MQTCLLSFRDNSVGKPEPWVGEDETTFKMWSEKFSVHMAGAGDKVCEEVLKHIGDMAEDDGEEEEDIESTTVELNIDPDLICEMQDVQHNQLTQHTKKELLAACANGWT